MMAKMMKCWPDNDGQDDEALTWYDGQDDEAMMAKMMKPLPDMMAKMMKPWPDNDGQDDEALT